MRYQTIPSDLFVRNREKLSRLLEDNSVVIVHSSDQMVRSGDQYYPYRQSPDFFYLTGIEQEMSVLLLCPDHKEKDKITRLFIRKPVPEMETWEGKKLSLEEAGKISGISSVYWLEDFEAMAHEAILKSRNIYCRTDEQVKFRTEYQSRDERYLMGLKEKYPAHRYQRLTPLLQKLRLKKEPEELEMIREAVRITAAGFRRVLQVVKDGIMEYELEAELTYEFLRRGASGHAYAPIIASGGNACILHYIDNDHILGKGQMLLMDFGAEYGNYSADCSRTVPVNGRFSKRQREIYEACHRLFRFARNLMKPGTTIQAIHEKVCEKSEEEHIRLGLYSKDEAARQKKDSPLFMKYFMHGISHFLGLDVHDSGDRQLVLEEGMVLTCEPGIYIAGEKTGIRLENDILITRDGNIDLMDEIPMDPGEIETLMNA